MHEEAEHEQSRDEAAAPWAGIRAVVLTASTHLAHGPEGDRGGDALAEWVEGLGGEVAGREVVSDSRQLIGERLRHWADSVGCDLILTTGGTGFAPNDVTPEATADVTERRAPGLPEAMRAASAQHTPNWMLSRAAAGIRGRTLILNFPGQPRAVAEVGAALEGAIPHAVKLLRGEPAH